MDKEFDEEGVKNAIKEVKEKIKQESDLFKSKRKAALTWNIIFFIGIISSTIVISIFTRSDTFNLKELLNKFLTDGIGIITIFVGILISFLVGILGSYYKTKALKAGDTFNFQEILKETYMNRLDKSKLNPQS